MYEKNIWQKPPGGLLNAYLKAMNTQEALADAAELIRDAQKKRRCTEGRGTEFYCPVLVLGGSYPGFLAAMMRMRYPAVVDMAYASSAPLRFYSQEVSQYEYYAKVTESAERSVKGCAGFGVSWVSAEVFVFLKLEEELQKGMMIETVCGSNSKGVE